MFYHLLYGIEKAACMGKGLGTRLKYHEGGGGREELCIVREKERICEDLGMVIPSAICSVLCSPGSPPSSHTPTHTHTHTHTASQAQSRRRL